MAAYVFLKLNKLTLTATEIAYERIVRAVAESKIVKADIAKFFQTHTHPSR